MKFRSTWLCPTPFDRARLLDMEQRIGKARGLNADNPLYVMASLACLVGLAAFSWTLMSSERSHREHAAVDPLTGLMNRKALSERFAELAAQAAIEDSWVTLIACDLDHFKAVNDEHGHDEVEAATVAERVRIGLQAAYPAGLRITASFGVAGGQGAAVDYAALYARADSALYEAKRGGRNRVVAGDAQPLRAVEAV